MKLHVLRPALAVLAAAVPGSTVAQAVPPGPAATTTVAVDIGVGQDSNPTLLSRAASAARFVVVAPSLTHQRVGGESRSEATLRAELLRHDGRPELDRANLEMSAGGVHALGTHGAAAWRVTVQDWHDPVGSSALARPDDEPDHFVAAAAGAVLRQDSLDDRVRLEAEMSLSRKQYQNHRDVTVLGDVATRGAILRAQALGAPGRLLWLGEWRGVTADYPFRPAALSHEDHRVVLGLRIDPAPGDAHPWGLQARLGWQRLGFRSLRPPQRAPVWDLQAHWQPVAAGARLDLSGQRQQLVAPGDLADVLRSDSWRLGWTQAWGQRFSGSLAATDTRIAYRYGGFADGENRLEHLRSVELSLRHDLGDGWGVSASALRSWRSASVDGFDYRRRVLRLTVGWSG